MKQKICHDDSYPPFSNFCSYCSRSKGCDSEDFREVPDGSPDTIHIDNIKAQEVLDEKIKSVSIGFAEWMSVNCFPTGIKEKPFQLVSSDGRYNKTSEELFTLYMDSLK